MTELHPQLLAVTEAIKARSQASRQAYLARMQAAADETRAKGPRRLGLDCTNLAHVLAGAGANDQYTLLRQRFANIGIVTAYNDMLSAHQPLGAYPELIKAAAREVQATAQVAGGVPAMCDGVTQGEPGMELSLFSRDVIAMSTAIALSHNAFDAVLCLGVCDKIVPGLLIGALSFGHLPVIFVPAGPMTSGLPNKEKARIRQLFAQGKIGREELLQAETQAYHGAGTCTFYGTANSNQMLMEIMGLHLPGSAFVNPNTPLREALTRHAAQRAAAITALGDSYRPLADIIDERALVNGMVGLHATGGSTNHSMHLIAIARAAGIQLNWDDFDALSRITPQLAKVYPNGPADVNQFHAAGGLSLVIAELLQAGLLHGDVNTIAEQPGLQAYTYEPRLDDGQLHWQAGPTQSLDVSIVSSVAAPISREGGLRVLQGNLGRAVIKTSAVAPEHWLVEAPIVIFDSQEAMLAAFKRGDLHKDVIVVVRFQGPAANGMPELHKLTPALGVLQDQGFKVALVTDGRMSGASGKVPAAIHVTPEASQGGALAKLRDGDLVRLDAAAGVLSVDLSAEQLAARESASCSDVSSEGMGRELFANFRRLVSRAEEGASVLW